MDDDSRLESPKGQIITSHCPLSVLKTALSRGFTTCIGTDQSNGTDQLSVLLELRGPHVANKDRMTFLKQRFMFILANGKYKYHSKNLWMNRISINI